VEEKLDQAQADCNAVPGSVFQHTGRFAHSLAPSARTCVPFCKSSMFYDTAKLLRFGAERVEVWCSCFGGCLRVGARSKEREGGIPRRQASTECQR